MPKIDVAKATVRTKGRYPDPWGAITEGREKAALGDVAGLTQFGVNLTRLKPGAASALRHWHEAEDEFVYVLEGELVLVTGAGEQRLTPGMCAGYPAGSRDAHHMINRSDRPARDLEIGNRIDGDNAFYPDDDLMWVTLDGETFAAHKDGHRY